MVLVALTVSLALPESVVLRVLLDQGDHQVLEGLSDQLVGREQRGSLVPQDQ